MCIDINWFETKIEEPVREIVKYLRNNGINTTCSCGHEMFVEGDITIDGELKKIHDLLYNYYCSKNQEPNYEITIDIKVENGCITKDFFNIKLKQYL